MCEVGTLVSGVTAVSIFLGRAGVRCQVGAGMRHFGAGGHVARRWGRGDVSAPLPPCFCPCPSGLMLTVFGLSQAGGCQRRTLLAAGVAAAWGLAPCGATRGFPVWPTAGLCLGSRNALLGTAVLRGVPLLGLESLACVCFSSL